jgi:AcrR family transcriptional regulator
MEKNGSSDFTLNEVARVGKVSIGSIYLRFNSKDELVNVVHARLLQEIDQTQEAMLAKVLLRSRNLRQFMEFFVDDFAEMLARYARGLRPVMLSAMSDTKVSQMGSNNYFRFAEKVKEAMLTYSAEFGRPNPESSVDFSFRVIYATVARYLGLGSSPEAAGQGDWSSLKHELSEMCTSYLIGADVRT